MTRDVWVKQNGGFYMGLTKYVWMCLDDLDWGISIIFIYFSWHKGKMLPFCLTGCGKTQFLPMMTLEFITYYVLIVDSMTLLIPLIPMDRFKLIHIIYIHNTLYYNAYIYVYIPHIYIYTYTVWKVYDFYHSHKSSIARGGACGPLWWEWSWSARYWVHWVLRAAGWVSLTGAKGFI